MLARGGFERPGVWGGSGETIRGPADRLGDGMSLTMRPGPLSGSPRDAVNYTIQGPEHPQCMHDVPRRVRAVCAGDTVLDTGRGPLLHEPGRLPDQYVQEEDVRP